VAEDEIDSLREALAASPENAALRRHLVDRLLTRGRPEEAEREAREGLARTPDDARLKLALATAFFRLGRVGPASVVVEEVLRTTPTPPAAYLLHSRLLLREGDVERAVRQYRRAVDEDPAVADPALAERLGVGHEEAGASVVDGRERLREGDDDEPGLEAPRPERPGVRFADVGGMERLKEEIQRKIVHPLRHPDLYRAYGKTAGGGILMFGPPGCGKTHLARATAGEVSASFLPIGIHEVLDMWIGGSERNLHTVFERARESRPCVLFFDEVDALGASRADMRTTGGRHLINQVLSELDGVGASNEGVLVLAATNAPWHLDPAFRRPGRFDRILFVPPPDEPARAAILRILLRGKPVLDVDVEHVAKKTKGFSGADLRGVVDRAVDEKLSEAIRAGTPEPLRTKDLLAAARGVKASTAPWFATARNHALYANQGGAYDDVIAYLDDA
jgi:transitional endoplasmic reticulum ATPase